MSVDERNDGGFTLVELMVTCLLTLIVLTAAGGLLISLSDGSAFGLTITVTHLPDPPATS